MVIQITNNNMTERTHIARLSFVIQLVILVKNTSLLAMYFINKNFDNDENAAMRPQ